jgi:selenocysteine-specific elongation factor
VHAGTAERVGTVILIDMGAPGAGAAKYCQIVMTDPVHVMHGDRFIIRDETARRTLGGGTVVDPWAAPLRRRDRSRRERLAALEASTLAEITCAYVERSTRFAVPWSELREFLNDPGEAPAEVPGVRLLVSDGEPAFAAESRRQKVEAALADALARFHAAHPLAAGMDIEEARAAMPERMSSRLFRELVEPLEKARTVTRQGNLLRAGGHQIRLAESERAIVGRIEAELGARPLSPPETGELHTLLGIDRQRLADLLRVMEQGGLIKKVAPTMYFLAPAIDRLGDELRSRLAGGRTITAAELRDHLKTSRKFAIPLLEYFDRTGLTVRVGDARKLRQPLERSSA